MKKIFVFIALVTLFTSTQATAQSVNPKNEVFIVGSKNKVDTAFGNGTLHQTSTMPVGGGISVSYYIDQINDSCAGYVSIWASLDGIVYFPYPGADSAAITVGVDVKKGWVLSKANEKNPFKFIDVRTRLTTSYTAGKGKVYTKLYPY